MEFAVCVLIKQFEFNSVKSNESFVSSKKNITVRILQNVSYRVSRKSVYGSPSATRVSRHKMTLCLRKKVRAKKNKN